MEHLARQEKSFQN